MTVTREQIKEALDALKSLHWHYINRTVNTEVFDGLNKTIRTVLQSALDATDTNVATKTPADTSEALDDLNVVRNVSYVPRATADKLAEALKTLCDLNNSYSGFEGEIGRDRIEDAWYNANKALNEYNAAKGEQK